jgi:hypothetical protein
MPNASLSVLVHGESKAGKSMMAVSGAAPRLLLDVESAARFLPISAVDWDPANPPPELGDGTDGGPDTAVVNVKDWRTAKAAYQWLHAGKHPFKSVAIDSISELQQRYIESVAGRSTVKIDQWGAVLREVGGFVRDLRDLTTHPTAPIETLVITSMTRERDGYYRPALQGQLMDILPYLVDVIGWLYIDADSNGTEVRRLLTRKRGKFIAGERVGGKIPPVMDLPFVKGTTIEEVRQANVTIRMMRSMVFPT